MISIIPAIDIINGKCVRLMRGDFQSKKIYDVDPLRVAKSYEAAGIQRLHLVDLDGARQKQIVNWGVLETIANQTRLQIDFGGGIQSEADLQIAFNSGAAQVTAGSIATKEPETVRSWLKQYGSKKIILGADVKGGKIAINAWREQTDRNLLEFLGDYFQAGARYTICTDISRDGLLQGPAFELYITIKQHFPQFYLIASGGVSSTTDVEKLAELKIDGVIIGKALYEGNIQLAELKPFLC